MLVVCKPSPLGGAARWRFRTGPIIDWPKTSCLLTPLTDNLVVDLNKLGFELMDWLPPTTLDTCLSELEHLFSPSDESSSCRTSYFCVGIPFGIAMEVNKWARVWCRNIWLQGLVSTWQRHDIITATNSIAIVRIIDCIGSTVISIAIITHWGARRRRGMGEWVIVPPAHCCIALCYGCHHNGTFIGITGIIGIGFMIGIFSSLLLSS